MHSCVCQMEASVSNSSGPYFSAQHFFKKLWWWEKVIFCIYCNAGKTGFLHLGFGLCAAHRQLFHLRVGTSTVEVRRCEVQPYLLTH